MMGTFLNSLNKKKSHERAASNFRDISSGIQDAKMARIALENEGDLDVRKSANRGILAVSKERTSRTLSDRRLAETGATGRARIADTGASDRQSLVTGENARQFDAGHALDTRKDSREGKAFDLNYDVAGRISGSRGDELISRAEADDVTNQLRARESRGILDDMDDEGRLRRRQYYDQSVIGADNVIEPEGPLKRKRSVGEGLDEDEFQYLDDYFDFGEF